MKSVFFRLPVLFTVVFLFLQSLLTARMALAQDESFRVGLKESPPFSFKNKKGQWEGISIHLWENVARELNLRYQYEEDNLSALFEKVKNKQLDIMIGAITVTPERETFVDYTHSIYSSGLGIASNQQSKPLLTSIVEGILSWEFLRSVLFLILILFTAGAILWLFERKRNPEQFGGSAAQGLGNGLWWSAVTMTTVGYGDRAPTTLGGRIIAVIWMFLSIMLISGITATIAASLTLRNLVPGIHSFADLPGRTIGTVAASSSDMHLKNEGFRRIQYYENIPAALEALRNLEIDAVVYDAPILKHYIKVRQDADSVAFVEDNSARQQYAFVLPEDAAMLEAINQSLLKQTFQISWSSTLEKYLPKPPKK